MTNTSQPPQQPGDPGPIAMKLLQGYVWQPLTLPELRLPSSLPMGAHLAIDAITAPFAFFDNGHPTDSQQFYQLTVLEVYPSWPSNETLHLRANQASAELGPLLEQTPPEVGWSLAEDLRPA
jgi:hypothetical protein